MASRGVEPDGARKLRLFSTWEITRYLIPVAQGHFRRVLKQNPELPQGRSETDGGAKWFALDEVLRLRAHFAAEGSKSKDYRPEGQPAKMVAVANFKGGVGKTSTAAHLAMSAALDGYKVLVIDLDSQGSMTSIFGGKVEDEWQTVFPLIARHYATHLRHENQRRLDRGDAPLPLDETLTKSLALPAQDLIQKTHWPNIDLIGSQLNLYWAEFQVPVWRMAGRGWKLWDALTETLAADGVLDAYDVVFIDTPPLPLAISPSTGFLRRISCWCLSGPHFLSSTARAGFLTCCTPRSNPSRTARTSLRAHWAVPSCRSSGTRCVRLSPAMTERNKQS